LGARRWLIEIVALAVQCAFVVPGAGTEVPAYVPSGQAVPVQARAYLQELDSYEHGEYEAAAAAVQALNVWEVRQWITAAIAEIENRILALERADVSPAEVSRLTQAQIRILRLALLVHTELVMRLREESSIESQLWLCQRILADMRHLKLPEDEHGARDREALRLLARDWYAVVVSQLQYLGNLPYLRGHLDAGLALFQDDPELVLAHGALDEASADLEFVDRSLAGDIYTRDFILESRRLLTAAAEDYQAVLQLQPGQHEAMLRLGRVSRLLGNRAGARTLYDAIIESDAAPRLKMLARLFHGELAELEKNPTEAEAQYRSAHALAPAAQSAMLAMSRLCDARGDLACARDWLERSFAAASPDRQDPWWGYLRGQAWLAGERATRLRKRGLGK